MEFESGFKAIVNNRELSESGVFSQELEAVEIDGDKVEIKYVDESGADVDPKDFKLIFGDKALYGSVSGFPKTDKKKFIVKSLDGRTILK